MRHRSLTGREAGLLFLECEGKVGYWHGDDGAELERMDYLEQSAR